MSIRKSYLKIKSILIVFQMCSSFLFSIILWSNFLKFILYSNNQAITFDINYRFNKPGDKPRIISSQNKAKRDEEWKSILDLRTLDEETYKVQNIISIHFDNCLQIKTSVHSHHCYE